MFLFSYLNMKSVLLKFVVFTSLIFSFVAADEADKQKIQGTWYAAQIYTFDGKEMPEALLRNASVIIDGNSLTLHKGQDVRAMTFKLDPKSKKIDITAQNFQLKGLYQINNEGLKIHWTMQNYPVNFPESAKPGSMTLYLKKEPVYKPAVIKPGSDEDKLQGVWKATSIKSSGQNVPKSSYENLKLIVKADIMLLDDGQNKEESIFQLRTTKKTKQIDFRGGNEHTGKKQVLGVYDLKENTLKMCWRKNDGERPKAFTTDVKDRKVILMTFTRMKPQQKK
ncbi:TIGR03067 domain-containing protein [Candidatus Uabimicrobium sp. HlEnr_7]|uniref:TIGR03067 domain-containing protein n=1 Tax=Candidatus Uabimicrobium helgolandensis TaxID=3095367 RepID=UPI003558F58F